MLRDDAARARLIIVLEAIAQAAPSTPRPADKPAALALAPNSLGAQLLFSLSSTITDLSDEVVQVARTVNDFPLLWS